MARHAKIIDVLIASPSDVAPFRDAIEAAILDWNSANEKSGIVLLPRRYERDVPPNLGSKPQPMINRAIVAKSDILIGVFWHRMGTQTEKAGSGTEEEIRRLIKKKKICMLYFCEDAIPGNVDTEQLDRLRTFRREMEAIGLVQSFSNADALKSLVVRNLSQTIAERFDRASAQIFSKNLSESPKDWRSCFDIHKGSYVMYSYRQASERSTHGLSPKSDLNICASLLVISKLSDRGIEFQLHNPQRIHSQNTYRWFTYKGLMFPAQSRFMYFFADQVEGNYEVLSAIIEYSPVSIPSFLIGHLVCVAVHHENDLFFPGSTGFLLKFLDRKQLRIRDLIDTEIGEIRNDDLDPEIANRIPDIYYSHIRTS